MLRPYANYIQLMHPPTWKSKKVPTYLVNILSLQLKSFPTLITSSQQHLPLLTYVIKLHQNFVDPN